MSYETELRINRLNTLRFIKARPMWVELIPVIRVKTSSGGFKVGNLPPRPLQLLRLIEQASAYGNNPGLIEAQDGKQRRVTFQLLGTYDAVMAVGDHWEMNGIRHEVVELLPFNNYERRGNVVQYG